jgi:hypothetical protein
MVSKGNAKSADFILVDDLAQRVDAARASHHRHRDAAAEAVAYVYLLYRDTRSGDGKKWFDKEIEAFNAAVGEHNTSVDNEINRAKNWHAGKLTADDHLMIEKPDQTQKAANDLEIAKLRRLLSMTSPDRTKLKRLSAIPRNDSSPYMPVVRYALNFNEYAHAAMVSRYCLVMKWIAGQFSSVADAELDQIKAAIEADGGFDCCVEIQRRVNEGDDGASQSDEQIILKAQNDDARAVVVGMKAKTTIQFQAGKAKDGFVVLLGRTNGVDLDVLAEADISDNELSRMIARVGDDNMIGSSPDLEFISRVLKLGSSIKEKQDVPSMSDATKKVTTESIVTLRSDPTGQRQLVVSVNRADACSILHATPKNMDLLSLVKGDCVLQGSPRRRIEREVSSAARRRLLTIKVNPSPKTAAGGDALSPLSWELHNRALAGRSSANQTFFWTDLNNISAKPLDVDNFRPEFTGSLDQSDVVLINSHLLASWRASTAGDKNKRVFLLELNGQDLKLTCGDADPLSLTLKTNFAGKQIMRFRIADIDGLIGHIADQHAVYEISGDSGGLLRFSWADDLAFYDYFIPTVGMDGRLMSRRVANMRPSPLPLAAE